MRNRMITSLWVLAACLPSLAQAQQQPGETRRGSWEFTAGVGFSTIDRAFNSNILVPMLIATPSPSRFALGVAGRIGYNVTNTLGFSVGTMLSSANGGSSNSPFVDLTWTPSPMASLSPFFMIGAGVTRFSVPGIHETSSFGEHFGMGVRAALNERLGLRLEGRMQGEQFEEQRPAGPAYNGAATLGLSYITAGRSVRDADHDGVPDRLDRCPNTAAGVRVDEHGCPLDSDHDGVPDGIDRCPNTPVNTAVDQYGCARDSDGDGVSDSLDRCPNTPAAARPVDATGCPVDTDHDGVADYLDKCPNTPANTRVDVNGCPVVADADNDGVPDSSDRCPNTPLNARPVDAAGCPMDSDHDGVPDYLDRCPNSPAGSLVDERGCPRDSDHDGVPDGVDKCPNTPLHANVDATGCTIVRLPATDADQLILRVQFVTNSSSLVRASTSHLDSVAVAIIASPGSLWEVQGFADARGSVRRNLTLSQARAQSVVDYLVRKGVPRGSMTAKGYGSERAVQSNTTVAGQAENRRVQLRRRPAPTTAPLP